MGFSYDELYQNKEDYFGTPLIEVIDFFGSQSIRGKLLDIGCGQGRNAIPLAEMGYRVTGIDTSRYGIEQMLKKADDKNLNIHSIIGDVIDFDNWKDFNFVLLDSMFHFNSFDVQSEKKLIENVLANANSKTKIVVCYYNRGESRRIFNSYISPFHSCIKSKEKELTFSFKEPVSGLETSSNYIFTVLSKK